MYPSFPPSVAFVGYGGPGHAAGWGDLGRVGRTQAVWGSGWGDTPRGAAG